MKATDQVLENAAMIRTNIVIGDHELAEDAACKVVKNIFEDTPTLGLDLDGTIDESPEFFSLLSRIWPGQVYVITCRSDEEKARRDADKFNIHYDRIVLVRRLEHKAAIIQELGVNVYVDDQDECLSNIDEAVTVLKIRNPGNCVDGKWLYSSKTGREI
jgi:uncharacterized HAD superfamily protein